MWESNRGQGDRLKRYRASVAGSWRRPPTGWKFELPPAKTNARLARGVAIKIIVSWEFRRDKSSHTQNYGRLGRTS
jgi:hypothetical protein